MEDEKKKKKKKKNKNKTSANPLPINDSNVDDVPLQVIPVSIGAVLPTHQTFHQWKVDSSDVTEGLDECSSVVNGITADEKHVTYQEHRQLLQEKAVLEEKLKKSISERNANLEEVVYFKQKLNDLLLDKKAVPSSDMDFLKLKVNELLNEKGILYSDLGNLQRTVNQLLNENNTLSSDTGMLKEKVNELENEKAALSLTIENMNIEIEAGGALIHKLITENSELVEKLNEIFINTNVGSVLPVEERAEESNVELQEEVIVRNSEDNGPLNSSNEDSSKEDDVERNRLDEEDDVERTISDAPLVGAPFRLISFMASYVSGADLVNNDSLT